MPRLSIIAACSLATLAVGVVFVFSRPPQKAPDAQAIIVARPAATTTEQTIARMAPEGMREYRNVAYHFSLLYSEELSVAEHKEGGDAITVTFQTVKKARGFQIFITPYNEPQVSEERFRQDEPSGVRESLTTVAVDGALGAAFYSANSALGATREVWFVHNGFLYEVTTLKPLDDWLDGILQTWQFL